MEIPLDDKTTKNEKSSVVKSKIVGSSDEKDEKAPDSSDNNGIQKTKTAKAKKRKKPKDVTAPRQPLTGYVRFLNERRETVRTENPSLPLSEVTRVLANEWTNLHTDKKQHYLDAALEDKERYTKEYNAYKQTQAYKNSKQANGKKVKVDNKDDSKVSASSVQIKEVHNEVDIGNCDIPIFTEEFLDHNKIQDTELRQLRKANTDYEQQNAVLQKHIENVKTAIEKLENDIVQQRKNNTMLQQHLDHLRVTLTEGFSDVKLPDELPTLNTIDVYMTNLHTMLLENSSQDANLLNTVRDIVGRLEFNG